MARAAYNYALARKIAAYDAFRERRVPTEAGLDVAVAEDQAKIEPALPRSKTNVGVWRKEWKSRESQWDERVAQLVGQGIPRDEAQRIAGQELRMLGWGVAEDGQLIECYTRQASSYSVHSAMQDADRSFSKWFERKDLPRRKHRRPRKDGRPPGFPRFHSKKG